MYIRVVAAKEEAGKTSFKELYAGIAPARNINAET